MLETATVPAEAREKALRAQQLIKEIKEAAAAGGEGAIFKGAEAQVEANRKMDEARKLLDEAKTIRETAAKKAAEGAFSAEDLEKLEREAAAMQDGGAPGSAGGAGSLGEILDGRSGGHRKEEASYNPFRPKNQIIRVGASTLARGCWDAVVPKTEREKAMAAFERGMAADTGEVRREKAALIEGTQANGGFLVVPQYLQDMFAAVRRQGNQLRRLGWMSMHQTEETNQVLFPKASGSLTVGLVAELAVKPTADNNYAQVTISLYTMAGIASISKQLSRSADPSIAEILSRDLALLLGNLEEQLALSGTGSQQPRGILNTTGLTATANIPSPGGSANATGQTIIDALIDGAAKIATTYYGPPTGALMRPSRLAWIQKTKDANGNYVLNRIGTFREPDRSQADGDITGSTYEILGIPLAQSTNVPANLGSGANQDCIILGDWRELHWFQRWDQQLDSSDIASDGVGNSAFATNRVLFRLEEIAGSTAERYPAAFAVITGDGMVAAY